LSDNVGPFCLVDLLLRWGKGANGSHARCRRFAGVAILHSDGANQ
jgi:hypothetical protein